MKFIAELCQNHNGDLDILKQLIQSASESGATHVKIQHIYAKNLTYRPVFENGHVVEGKIHAIKRPFDLEYLRLAKLELDNASIRVFIEEVSSLGLVPLTTAFTLDSVDDIYSQGFREVKIASYDASSYPLIRKCLERFDHVYISTGATYDSELERLREITKNVSNVSVFHCVTSYPTSYEMMNLSRINYLKKLGFENVGYSDHSSPKETALDACFLAISIGANIIERHFTILPEDKTKDGKVSVTPNQFRRIVDFGKSIHLDQNSNADQLPLNTVSKMMGLENRNLSHIELLNRDYYRGRFASPRVAGSHDAAQMRFNWEEA